MNLKEQARHLYAVLDSAHAGIQVTLTVPSLAVELSEHSSSRRLSRS